MSHSTQYQPRNFERLLGTPGFSDKLLKNHFKLYEAYVKNTNELLDRLESASPEEQKAPEIAEVRRRFGWEWNGMRLHEYYFGNMAKDGEPLDADGAFARRLNSDFGSFDEWRKSFAGIGAMRGIGWVLLVHDVSHDRLLNVWINEHDLGFLAGAKPIFVMDVFEHAFMTDYGLEKSQYIEAFWKAADWKEAERRFLSEPQKSEESHAWKKTSERRWE